MKTVARSTGLAEVSTPPKAPAADAICVAPSAPRDAAAECAVITAAVDRTAAAAALAVMGVSWWMFAREPASIVPAVDRLLPFTD